MTSYDTICHEHLEYYSLAVLEHILREAGLRARQRQPQRDQRRLDPLSGRRTPPTSATGGTSSRTTSGSCARKSSTCSSTPTSRTGTSRSGSTSTASSSRALLKKLRGEGKRDPRLRRLDQGEHHPAVVRRRQPAGRRRAPSATPTSTARARSARTSRSSARKSRAPPSRTTTWSSPGTSGGVPAAREGLPGAGGPVDLPAARRARRAGLRAGQPAVPVDRSIRIMWPISGGKRPTAARRRA